MSRVWVRASFAATIRVFVSSPGFASGDDGDGLWSISFTHFRCEDNNAGREIHDEAACRGVEQTGNDAEESAYSGEKKPELPVGAILYENLEFFHFYLLEQIECANG